jgi:hypothetical protein
MVSRMTAHKRVLRWGNSFGIRLTRKDLDRLGIQEDDEVDLSIEPCRPQVDWDKLPTLSLGGDASARHDEIIFEGLDEDHA